MQLLVSFQIDEHQSTCDNSLTQKKKQIYTTAQVGPEFQTDWLLQAAPRDSRVVQGPGAPVPPRNLHWMFYSKEMEIRQPL